MPLRLPALRIPALVLALPPLSLPAQEVPPPAAPAPQQPVFVAEFGLRHARAEPQMREALLSFLRRLDEEGSGLRPVFEPPALPARLRVFAAPGIEAIEQSRFLLCLDLPHRIDLSKLGPEGMRPQPVPGDQDLFRLDHWTLRWVPAGAQPARSQPAGSQPARLLLTSGYDLRGALPGWMQELAVPRLRKAAQRLLEKARRQYAYWFIYAGALQRHVPTIRQQVALVGPDGLALAMYMHQIKGHVAYTMDWGMGLGSGVLGSALPRDAGDAQVLAAGQATSDYEYYADLGSGGTRMFGAILGLVQANLSDRQKQISDLFAKLLEASDGRLAVRIRDQDGPEGGGIGIAEDSAEKVLRMLQVKLKQFPAIEELEVRAGEGANTLHAKVGGRDLSVQPQARHLSFQLGTGGERDPKELASRQRLLAVLPAPLKIWVSPRFFMTEIAASQDELERTSGANTLEGIYQQAILSWGRRIAAQGILVTADWDEHGTRLSYIFGAR